VLSVRICIFPNENVMFPFHFLHLVDAFILRYLQEKQKQSIKDPTKCVYIFKARFIRLYKADRMQLSPHAPLNGLRRDFVHFYKQQPLLI